MFYILSFQISEKAIATLSGIKIGGNNVRSSFSWKIEEAKVFWFQGEQETAMRQLKQINIALKVSYVSSNENFYIYEICITFLLNHPSSSLQCFS